MYILSSMFVISGNSLYPGFTIERVNCTKQKLDLAGLVRVLFS